MIFQDSAGASGTGPDAAFGHLPCRSLYASAHRSISGIVIGRGCFPPRPARFHASTRRRLDPPGSPRMPFERALSIAHQFSPGASMTGPEAATGHRPLRA